MRHSLLIAFALSIAVGTPADAQIRFVEIPGSVEQAEVNTGASAAWTSISTPVNQFGVILTPSKSSQAGLIISRQQKGKEIPLFGALRINEIQFTVALMGQSDINPPLLRVETTQPVNGKTIFTLETKKFPRLPFELNFKAKVPPELQKRFNRIAIVSEEGPNLSGKFFINPSAVLVFLTPQDIAKFEKIEFQTVPVTDTDPILAR